MGSLLDILEVAGVGPVLVEPLLGGGRLVVDTKVVDILLIVETQPMVGDMEREDGVLLELVSLTIGSDQSLRVEDVDARTPVVVRQDLRWVNVGGEDAGVGHAVLEGRMVQAGLAGVHTVALPVDPGIRLGSGDLAASDRAEVVIDLEGLGVGVEKELEGRVE